MPRKDQDWTSVSLSSDLMHTVDQVVQTPNPLGFRSRADLIHAACRLFLWRAQEAGWLPANVTVAKPDAALPPADYADDKTPDTPADP